MCTDLKVGFSQESYSVAEPFGRAEVTVRILPDETGNVPRIEVPFGLRITSADGSAVGKTHHALESHT